jgi:glycosyltransferase involved in cell wall biosynthesis
MQTATQVFYLNIGTVPKGIKRPLWSVLIPTYNCAHYLKETLASVLAQDPGEDEMEIIVIDDYSTKDDPQAIVKAYGQGRVQFIRQKENLGKVRNYETGLKASKGHYIHQLHGDDKVRLGFYKEMARLLKQNRTAGAAFCRTIYIDSQSRWTGMTGMLKDTEGIVPDMAEKLYTQQYIQTPSMVVKRSVYETIGCFDRRLNCMEDWEMWTRVANNYPIAISNSVLAEYRSHEFNATVETFYNGSALDIHEKVHSIVDTYIDKTIINRLKSKRDKAQSQFLWVSLIQIGNKMSISVKGKLKKRIFKLDPSLKTVWRLLTCK